MSIKKKLVTAVTTAGLLAGLFGSAFVPVARAASVATAATVWAGGDGTATGIQYYAPAVAPSGVTTLTVVNANDDGAFSLDVTGTTFTACGIAVSNDAAGGGSPAVAGTVVGTTQCSTTVTADTAGDAIAWTFATKKLAAGASATVILTDPDGDEIYKVTLTGRTAVSGVVSADKSTLVKNAAGDVTTSAGLEYVDSSAKFVLDGKINDANTNAITSTPVLLVTIDAGDLTLGTGNSAANARGATGAAGTKAATATITLNAAGFYAVDVYHPGVDYAGGTYTVTVKLASTGAVVSTYTGGFIGAAATVTATPLATNVASAIDAHVTDFYTVAVKDSKGFEWHQAAMAITITAKDETGTAQATFANDSTDGDADKKFDYDKETCASGKKTKTRTITFESAAGISANTKPTAVVTLTCRADDDATYTLSSLSFEKATPLAGELIDLTFGYADADGGVAGYGAVVTSANYKVSLTNATNTDITADGDIDAAVTLTSNDGTFSVEVKADTSTGKVLQVTIPGSSLVATALTIDSSYNGTISVGPKKLKATADFGLAAAGKKIAFVLESANGSVKTFYRKANGSGVATYTLRMSGTWEAYATYGDNITDTVTMSR